MGGDVVEADACHVVQRGAEADGLDDGRGSGLEAVRRLGVGDVFQGDFVDHLAAALIGRHAVQMLGLAIEHADAGGAIGLVAGEDIEIRIEVLDVDGHVNGGLAAIDQHRNAAGMGDA